MTDKFVKVIPIFKHIDILDNWKVAFNSVFETIFSEKNTTVFDSLNDLSIGFGNYRNYITLNGISFSASIICKEKLIILTSPNMSQELFILETLSNEDIQKLIKNDKNFYEFKHYMDKIVKLDPRDFPTRFELITYKYRLAHLLKNDNLYTSDNADLSRRIEDLLFHVRKYKSSFLEKITDKGLALTAKYALLRIHLLKFIAILPSLDHDEKGNEVKKILMESFRRIIEDSKKAKLKQLSGQNQPLPIIFIQLFKFYYLLVHLFPASMLASIVRFKVKFMAKRFIAGTDIEDAKKSISTLSSSGRCVTLDQLGELVVSETEADHYMNKVINLIQGFSIHFKKGEKNSVGINKAHVSIKVSALCSDFRPESFEQTYKLVAPRLIKILVEAKKHNVFINIDAEHYHYRDLVFDIFSKVLLSTKELADFKSTGIVIQAYLIDAYEQFEKILELAKKRKITMPVRLVKGAYWDAETIEAKAHSFSSYQFLNKEETDLHFRQILIKILESHPHLQLCIASHNYADHSLAEIIREKHFPEAPGIEHQCLHMTYEALSYGLAKMGWATRNYVPVGSLLVGMAYLVRRIMENSSQVGVLTIMRSHKQKTLLDPPEYIHNLNIKNKTIIRDWGERLISSKFFNVKPLRLYIEDEKNELLKDLSLFNEIELGKEYKNYFENKYKSLDKIDILSSSDQTIKVGHLKFVDPQEIEEIVSDYSKNWHTKFWCKSESWQYRSFAILKLANLLHLNRNRLASLITYEAGKSINESLADVDEAIDFCTFYAREESRYNQKNEKITSRGLSVIIPPWNFPLAIPCGMVVASLVTGNPTILKSSELTPLIATLFSELVYLSGVPKDIFIHLPGVGETVGQKLVENKNVATYAFTGSKAVGKMIYKVAGSRLYQTPLKENKLPVKVIAEMGGKNAIIVTKSAELDETVSGIIYSTFGHAGQKCSACSRIIVDESVKERLIERLIEALKDIKVGKAYDFSTYINPIISPKDKLRLISQVKLAINEATSFGGRVLINRSEEHLPGNCVGPTLIELTKERSFEKSSYAQVELFGPVLHLISFNQGLDEALKIINSIDYALTTGIYSQSQDDIDYLSSNIEAGNIYVNRPITGARVAIEPFGGFKLSGTGPKAGSKDYLQSFHLFNSRFEKINHKSLEENTQDNQVVLCIPNNTSLTTSLNNVDLALRRILNSFEVYFEISGKKKKCLSRYKKWLSEEGFNYFETIHYNRSIPGQESYNDFSICTKKTVVISTFEKPSFTQFMVFLAAVSSGSGVTICATNGASFKWWKKIINIFHESNIGIDNISVHFVNPSSLNEIIFNKDLENIIIDGDTQYIEKISKEISASMKNSKNMKKIITWIDGKDISDYENLTSDFVNVRSFAVNTMRHGAPLQLEF